MRRAERGIDKSASFEMSKRSNIDRDEVRKLAAMGLTVDEIAAFVGVCGRTIERRCKDDLVEGRSKVCGSVRRKQYEKAVVEGNTTMLIWLGKQMLGQKDVVEVNSNVSAQLDIEDIRKRLKGSPANEPASPH